MNCNILMALDDLLEAGIFPKHAKDVINWGGKELFQQEKHVVLNAVYIWTWILKMCAEEEM